MYLKKLESFGFKSFADRTELGFPSGMTSIVGPNGCGKSNVVDAFKWIFGEQSAKGLRGAEMKDVIFNGTLHRKPTGFAEVTVVFDNAERFFAVDFAEVAITRRLYRSGESEYLINRERCRLKDIKELLMDTGIGRTSYSILEQGKIDVLLQASQYDRRIVFEEAAGISKYRAKKAETLRALTRVEDNLTRLNDILEEVDKRVTRLKAQASKARRYRRYSERLKELRVRAAVEGFKKSLETRTEVACRLYWSQFQIRRAESVLAALNSALDAQARDRQSLADRLRDLREKQSSEQVLVERTHQRIEHGRQRLEELEEEQERKQNTIQETTAALDGLRAQLADEAKELETVRGEIEALGEVLSLRSEERDSLRQANECLQETVRQQKDQLVSILQSRARVANEVVQLESEISSLDSRRRRLQSTIDELEEARKLEGEKAESEHKGLSGLYDKIRGRESVRDELESAIEELTAQSGTLQESLEEQLSLLSQRRSRLDVLETLEKNLEGVGRGVREILQKEGELEEIGNVHGLLASLVQVEHKYARAVEGVLGAHAQAFVVETQDGALGLIDLAREEEIDAVEVICLDRVDMLPDADFSPHDGVFGRLRDLVDVEEPFGELLDRLLANVLVVRDFDTALSLSRNGLRPFRLVTLDGEMIEPWGAFALNGKTEFGLISRRSEMEELAAQVAELTEKESQRRSELSAVRIETASKREELDGLNGEVAALSREVAQREEKISQTTREIDRLEREASLAREELAEIEADCARRNTEREGLDSRLKEVDGGRERCEHLIRSHESEAVEAGEKLQTAEESLTRSRLELAQAQKREEGLGELLRRQEGTREEKEEALQSLTADTEGIRVRRQDGDEQLKASSTEFEQASARLASLSELLEAEEETDRESQLVEQRFQKEIDHVRSEVDRLNRERESAQLRDQEERHQRNTIVERIDEEYGIDLTQLLGWEKVVLANEAAVVARTRPEESQDSSPSEPEGEAEGEAKEPVVTEDTSEAVAAIVADMPPEARFLVVDPEWDSDAARQEIKKLQDSMRRMGSVNLEALEELEELEERFVFQQAQRDDLTQSAANLRQIIDEINHTSREKFLETFKEVQSHFSELFRKCFGGGKAELLLEESVDVLDSGIEIVARPPGKKISSLSLMSGGEKTMTTLALLFAIFRARPSPFCILDEVDAPLDDENVRRFIVLLKEFQEDTQFIVVTHNKATMAEADTLYGVTMQEPGVSTKVAVELESYDASSMEEQALRN